MREGALSDSIVRRRGRRPIVVFAPHGGRRTRPLRRGDGINDLYTAEIATELAERLDAHAIVNCGIDRNDVDLNRISALVAHAPAVLAMLRETIESAREGDAVPLVLLIHGWNVSSLHCDVGIGLRERDGELVGAQPTVSPQTFETFVRPLRGALERSGLEAFVGHRYPASGADNTTQLFSGRHCEHAHPEVLALSRMAMAGGVDAVQLELSIVLRWPGEHRDRFVDALASASLAHLAARNEACARAAGDSAQATPLQRNWARRAKREDPVEQRIEGQVGVETARFTGESLQAVLGNGGGLFMAIEPADRHSVAARVCVALPDGRLALFVCEAPLREAIGEDFNAGGLRWQVGSRARFAGPAVLYPTHDAFLDLEQGLGGATLAHLEVDVGGASEAGSASSGYVRIGERRVEVIGQIVRRTGGRLGGGSPPVARLYLTDADSSAPLVIEQRGDVDDDRCGVVVHGREVVARHPVLGEMRGHVTVRIPVYRPVGDGRYLEILFGVAELVGAGGPRRAIFETVSYLNS